MFKKHEKKVQLFACEYAFPDEKKILEAKMIY